jgi:hypothetical protein
MNNFRNKNSQKANEGAPNIISYRKSGERIFSLQLVLPSNSQIVASDIIISVVNIFITVIKPTRLNCQIVIGGTASGATIKLLQVHNYLFYSQKSLSLYFFSSVSPL